MKPTIWSNKTQIVVLLPALSLLGIPFPVQAQCPLSIKLEYLKKLEGTEWETPTLKKILEKNRTKSEVDISTLEIADIRDLYLDWEWLNFTKQKDPLHKKRPKASWLQKYEKFKTSRQGGYCETCTHASDFSPLGGKESFTQLLDKSISKGSGLRSPSTSSQPWLVARDFFSSLKSPAEVGLKESQRLWKEQLLYNSKTGGFKMTPKYLEGFDNFFDPLAYNIRQCQSGSIQSSLGPVLFRDGLQEKDLEGIYFQLVPHHIRPAYLNKDGAIELGESTSINSDTALYRTGKEYCEKHANSRLVSGRDLLQGKVLMFFHDAIQKIDPQLYNSPDLLTGSSPRIFSRCAEQEASVKLGVQACLTPDELPDSKDYAEADSKHRERSKDGQRGNSYFGTGMKDPSPRPPRAQKDPSEDQLKEPGFFDPSQNNTPSVLGEGTREIDSENLRDVLAGAQDLEKKDWYQKALHVYKLNFPKAKQVDQKLIAYLTTDVGYATIANRWSPNAMGDKEIEELVSVLPDPETLVIEVDPAREWSPEKIKECQDQNSNCTPFVELMNDLYEDFSGPHAVQIESLTKEQKVKKIRELSRKFQKLGITLTDYQEIMKKDMESIEAVLDRMEKDKDPEMQEQLDWFAEGVLKNIRELAPVKREKGSRYVVMGTGTLDDWESILSDVAGSENGASLQVAVTKWSSWQQLRVKLVGSDKRVALDNTVSGTFQSLDNYLTFYKDQSREPMTPFHSDEMLTKSMTEFKNKVKEQTVVTAIDNFDQEIQRKKLGFDINFLSEDKTIMDSVLAEAINKTEEQYPGYTAILKAFVSQGKLDVKLSQDKNASVKWNDELRRMEYSGIVYYGKYSKKAKIYRPPSAFGMCLILEKEKVSESMYDNAQGVAKGGKVTGSLKVEAKKACAKLKKAPLQYFKISSDIFTNKSAPELSFNPKAVSYPYTLRLFEDLKALRPDLKAKIDHLRAIYPGEHIWRIRDDYLVGDYLDIYEAKLGKFLEELNRLEEPQKKP